MEIYACLAGDWVCLNDDPNCRIGPHMQSPSLWYQEGAPIYSPKEKDKEYVDSYYGIDYVHIRYKGNDWRLNPIFLQILDE